MGPQATWQAGGLPECEGRISGEFAELMTASCRAAVYRVADLGLRGSQLFEVPQRGSYRESMLPSLSPPTVWKASQPQTEASSLSP